MCGDGAPTPKMRPLLIAKSVMTFREQFPAATARVKNVISRLIVRSLATDVLYPTAPRGPPLRGGVGLVCTTPARRSFSEHLLVTEGT